MKTVFSIAQRKESLQKLLKNIILHEDEILEALHKANLEGDYTHFGISIRANTLGKKYYANIFMKK